METKNKLPGDWERKKFNDIIESSMSGDWGSKEGFKDSMKCRVIRGTDIPHVTSSRISGIPVRFVERKKFERKVPKDEQFLIEISGGSKDQPTGRIAMISPSKFKENIFYSNFMKLVDINKEIVPSYFFYFWNFLYNSPRFVIHENRTTNIRNFRFNQFISNEDIYFPKSLEEQKSIAKILSVVDKSIEKTNKIIEKVERVKKNVMQDFFGKNYEEYKIREISKTYAGGTPSRKKREYFFGHILWVKSGEVNQRNIYDTEEKISQKALEESSAKIVPKNTVLVAMYGATAGKVGILKREGTTNQAILSIPDTYRKFNFLFMYYLLSSKTNKLINATQGTGQPNLSKTLIDNLKITLPSPDEQQKIANILSTIDQKLENERKRKEKLERVKKGLMQDLLTGKKRVNVNKVLEVRE